MGCAAETIQGDVRGLPTSGFNKAIQNLWMSTTDACNMRCDYCFVPKGDKFMSRETGRRAIDFALNAPSDYKRIDYYGGEPLLNDHLLQFSMPYALELGAKLGKQVRTYISTNATLYKPSMTYLRDCDVHVLISIDGDAEAHDLRRRKNSGAPSHEAVVAKFHEMQDHILPHNLCGLWTVDPDQSHRLYENWDYLRSIGFRCVNIEPVRTRRWTPEKIREFTTGVRRILKVIDESIVTGNPDNWLFINSMNHEFVQARGIQERSYKCPFYINFIVYPTGKCTITPTIVFEHLQDYFMVGDTEHGLLPQYEACTFDDASARCRACIAKGESAEQQSDKGVEQARSRIYRAFCDYMVDKSRENPAYGAYILESEKWCYV